MSVTSHVEYKSETRLQNSLFVPLHQPAAVRLHVEFGERSLCKRRRRTALLCVLLYSFNDGICNLDTRKNGLERPDDAQHRYVSHHDG